MIDYQAQDEALDDELRAMYAPESEEAESDSLDESTESQQEEEHEENESPEQELEASTPVDSESATETAESMVEESRYKNAVVAMNKAQQELADRRKQDAQRDELFNSQQAQLQQLQAQLQELQAKAPEKTESPAKEVDDDELTEALDLYPEVVNPLLKIIDNLKSELSGLKNEVGNVKGVADRYQQTEQKTAQQAFWDEIKSKHDDVEDIVSQPEYAEWFSNQAPMIQKALSEGTPRDVISALNLYRADHPRAVPDAKEKPVSAKQDKLAAAKAVAAPQIKGQQKAEAKPTFTTAQIAKMSREEFMKNEAAIDEALARNEII